MKPPVSAIRPQPAAKKEKRCQTMLGVGMAIERPTDAKVGAAKSSVSVATLTYLPDLGFIGSGEFTLKNELNGSLRKVMVAVTQ